MTTGFHEWLKEQVLSHLDDNMQPSEIADSLRAEAEQRFPGKEIKLGSVRGWLSTARRDRERKENAKKLKDQIDDLRSMVAGMDTAQVAVVNAPTAQQQQEEDDDPTPPTPMVVQTITSVDADLAAYRSEQVSNYVQPDDGSYEAFMYCVERDKPCVLVGDPGTGKSTMGEVGLIMSGRDPYEITCDENTERDDFFGATKLINDDGVQVTDDQAGVLVLAAIEGRPLLINEVAHVPSGVQSALFPAMEKKPFRNPISGELIVPKQGFFIVATANHLNLGDQRENEFTTGRMSWAFRSRFAFPIPVPYLTPDKEIQMIVNWTGAKRRTVEQVVQFANLTRDVFRAGDLRMPICSRIAKELAEYLDAGNDIKSGLKYVVLGRAPRDDHAKFDEAAHTVWSF